MESITYEALEQTLDYAALHNTPAPRSYSGRGMEGDECAAVVVGDEAEFALFFVALPTIIGEDQAQYVAKHTRTDGMGRGIVVYWPGIEIEGTP